MKKLLTIALILIPILSFSQLTYDCYLINENTGAIEKSLVSFKFNPDKTFSVYCNDSAKYYSMYRHCFNVQTGRYYFKGNKAVLKYDNGTGMLRYTVKRTEDGIKLECLYWHDVLILKKK